MTNNKNIGEVYEFTLSPAHERYYSDETYFGVYEFSTSDKIPHTHESLMIDSDDRINIGVIAGTTGKLEYGVEYKIKAEIDFNSKYKSWQYKPVEVVPIVPTERSKAEKFLRSIITSNQSDILLEKYPNIIDMVMNKEEIDLTGIKGIKEKTFEKIREKIESSYGMMELTVFLNPLGVSATVIERLFESGTSANVIKSKIKENPYIISNISGFGFKRADDIALKINPNFRISKYRTMAYVKYLLNDVANNHGHTWVSSSKFLEECRLNIPECKEFVLELLREENSKLLYIDRERKRIGLKSLYDLENNIAEELIRLKYGSRNFTYDSVDKQIKDIENRQGWNFTDEQLEGVKKLIDNQVVAITGLGGTGKSSVSNAFINIFNNYKIAQTTLSGKAALRMTEINGKEASTIHRLLGFQEGRFVYNKMDQLEVDLVIIDEASMIGADLFYDLLQAIPTGAKVIITGDIGQLESIGVGSVFKDILESEVIPIVKLTQIHRQAQKSAIITESINIRNQKHIIDKDFYGTRVLGELQDLYLDIYEDKSETIDRIMHYFKLEYAKSNDIMEIQVIVPMRERGDASVYNINNKIQEIVNPSHREKMEISLGLKTKTPYIIRVGDKVMNMVNQYKTEDMSGNITPVFNGNLGIVKAIYEKYMIIDFIGIGELVIDKKNWKNIELGYACSCHKAQGSQFTTVIVGIDSSSYVMLSKEWLYTGITRSIKKCYLCGDNYAIRKSITTSKLVNKLTSLKEMLMEKEYLYNKKTN